MASTGWRGGRDAVALATALAANGTLSYAHVRVVCAGGTAARLAPGVYDADQHTRSRELLERARGARRISNGP